MSYQNDSSILTCRALRKLEHHHIDPSQPCQEVEKNLVSTIGSVRLNLCNRCGLPFVKEENRSRYAKPLQIREEMNDISTSGNPLPRRSPLAKIKGFFFYLLEDPDSKPRNVFNLIMILIVLSSVVGMILEVDPYRTAEELRVLAYLEDIFIHFFITEYLLSFWVCSDFKDDFVAGFRLHKKRNYQPYLLATIWFGLSQAIAHKIQWMRQPIAIVDLLAILPVFRVFRLFLILRVLRVLKLFRYSKRLSFFSNILKERSFELVSLFTVAIVVWGMIAIAFFVVERVANPKITSIWEGVYWAIITITTVGYGDIIPVTPMGRGIAVVGTLFGMWVVVFMTSIIVSALTDRIVNLQEIRMENRIDQLKNHVIVCGLDTLGQAVCNALQSEGQPFVAVDSNSDRVEQFREQGWLTVQGDVTERKVWDRIGLQQAHSVISSIAQEATNVYVILMVRELWPESFIVACGATRSSEQRLQRVGADRVVSPSDIGGRKLAQTALRPTVTRLIDTLFTQENAEITLEEIIIPSGALVQDKPLKNLYMRQDFRDMDIIVIGHVKANSRIYYNPKGETVLCVDDILMCMGHRDNLERFRSMLWKEGVRFLG